MTTEAAMTDGTVRAIGRRTFVAGAAAGALFAARHRAGAGLVGEGLGGAAALGGGQLARSPRR